MWFGGSVRFAAQAIATAIGLALLGGCEPTVSPERDLIVATASTGGTFYPVGVALANRINADHRAAGIQASAITSSGAMENLAMLRSGEVQLAILGSLQGVMAWRGVALFDGWPQQDLRSIAGLWPNVEQAVLSKRYVTTGTLADLGRLDGRRLSVGPRWSGTEVATRIILETLGIAAGQAFRPVYLGYGASADALQNHQIEGFFFGAGVPTSAVTQAYAARGGDNVALLSVSDEQLATLRRHYPVWDRFVIPANTYPGQTEPVQGIAQLNFLGTRADVDEAIVYAVTRSLWEGLEDLQRTHAATRSMALERALDGLVVPLHPGAAQFYRERGLTIPEHLLPPEWAVEERR